MPELDSEAIGFRVASGYGDLWWLGELPCGHGTEPIVVANGWESQFIVVFPRLDMVLITTGGNEDSGRHMDFGRVLARTLLAGMQERASPPGGQRTYANIAIEAALTIRMVFHLPLARPRCTNAGSP